MLPSEVLRLTTDPPVGVFPGVWKLLSFLRLPWTDLSPYLFCLSFYLLYFLLPPFEDNGLPFWVSDVLCQHSEIVLWNFLSVQMFFQWICGGENGLPVLFLCHRRTASLHFFFISALIPIIYFHLLFLAFCCCCCCSFISWFRCRVRLSIL